jgi:hypothetical protein
MKLTALLLVAAVGAFALASSGCDSEGSDVDTAGSSGKTNAGGTTASGGSSAGGSGAGTSGAGGSAAGSGAGGSGAGGSGAGGSGGDGSSSGGSGGSASGGVDGSVAGTGGSSGSGATGGVGGAGGGNAAEWIIAHFAGAPVVTGSFTSRTAVETPALVRDASGCCAKYAYDVREQSAPDDRRVGFVNVTIRDLVSSDAFGGGIQSASAAGLVLFLADVQVEPNWPTWVDYATTNKDGLVLDGAAAIYAEDLTIANWNADGAIDNKAPISQFVRLTLEGRGNRGIRYWGAGPHYLVASNLNNAGGAGEGSLLWFQDCGAATVRIYDSKFNGSATVPASLISCENGSAPNLVYLTTDPRTTGEMHEMFSPGRP